MSLKTVKGSAYIPEGAVKVTKEEALSYQKTLIRDWKNESDVIFLKYGKYISTAITLYCSTISWRHFMSSFNLTKGKLLALPGISVPAVINLTIFDNNVTNKVLLMRNECPLCWQLLFGVKHTFLSVVYPIILGSLCSASFATVHNTYDVPDFKKQPKEFFKVCYKVLKPMSLKFQSFAAVCLLSSIALPYLQNNELINVQRQLEKPNSYDDDDFQ